MGKKKKNKRRQGGRCSLPPVRKGNVIDLKPKVPWEQRATISLCMIVKNEEKHLANCLNSVLAYVDEVIIVDTGSIDHTTDILREAQQNFKQKKGGRFVILHQPWDNSFSKARNHGIEMARGDFIFQIDADEEVERATAPLLMECSRRMKYEDLTSIGAVFFELQNVLRDGSKTMILHPHLFRREGLSTGTLFHFEGRVHNKPIYEGEALQCPMKIFHYGYGEDDAIMLAKHKRRKTMVQAMLDDDPDGFWPNFYMSQTLSSETGAIEETIKYSKRTIEIWEKASKEQGISVGVLARPYYSWMLSLIRGKRAVECLEVGAKCQEAIPWYPDTLFFTAWAHMHIGNWKECCIDCVRFFDAQQRATEDESIKANFIGVENLTLSRAPAVVQFWRVASKHHLGLVVEGEKSQEPELSLAGYQMSPEGELELGVLNVGKDAEAAAQAV